jgi:hypothetical protein
MINYKRHINFPKGLKWELYQDGGYNGEMVYRTSRIEDDKTVAFAAVVTRPSGQISTFVAKVTLLGSKGISATTLERTFEGRNCQYTARKWAEIMLYYPPNMVVTHVEM